MVSAVSLPNQDRLASQGFAINGGNWFSNQTVALYTHRALGHRKVGEVALSVHVQNPRALNDYESHQFARKAEFGMFPWKAGADCMTHEFTKVERVPRPGGGFQVVRGEKVMGCKWCRVSQSGQQGAVTETEVRLEPLPPAAVTPPAAATVSLKCEQCNFTTTKGDSALRVHVTWKHSGTRRARTRKGAGRRN